MALKLVVDNVNPDGPKSERQLYLGKLLKAVYWDHVKEPIPGDLQDLLLNLDVETVEGDLAEIVKYKIKG